MRNHWASHLLALAGWLLGAVVLGLVTGELAWWLVGALVAYVAYMLRNVYLLDRVITGGPRLRTFGLGVEDAGRLLGRASGDMRDECPSLAARARGVGDIVATRLECALSTGARQRT